MTTTEALADDKFHDECGVFGIYGDGDAAAESADDNGDEEAEEAADKED